MRSVVSSNVNELSPIQRSAEDMTIRSATTSDSAEIAELSAELGYSVPQDCIEERLSRVLSRTDQLVVVAVLDGKMAGWVQAHASDVLESGFGVEIVGLIVSHHFRRRRVGRRLVECAERWATTIGAEALVVRSNTKREESHQFYPSLGFGLSKSQTVYQKDLRNQRNQPLQPTPIPRG